MAQSFPGDDFDVDASNRPLIAPLAPMLTLREEYENGSQYFVKQIDWLISQGWNGIRRTRGDGQCLVVFTLRDAEINYPPWLLQVTVSIAVSVQLPKYPRIDPLTSSFSCS